MEELNNPIMYSTLEYIMLISLNHHDKLMQYTLINENYKGKKFDYHI